nr:hypothetical protein [Tanacetum cinerariifolium]
MLTPTNNNLRTSSNSKNKNVDNTLRYVNENQTGQFGNQRTMTVDGSRETIGSQQVDWLEDTGEEIDEQELEAHYCFMAKIQEHSEQLESINDTYVVEKDDSNVIPDSSHMCDNDNQADQNAEECDDERSALANLIANLTLDTKKTKRF